MEKAVEEQVADRGAVQAAALAGERGRDRGIRSRQESGDVGFLHLSSLRGQGPP